MGYHVDDMQTMPPVELQLMTSWGSHTKRSHKSITQTNRTRQDDVTSKNGNDKQCFHHGDVVHIICEPCDIMMGMSHHVHACMVHVL